MQQDLCKNYRIPVNKTVVIHNAVQANPQVKAPAAGHDKIYKLVTVTRLSGEKGIERLIHAVGLLSIPFQFFIIGGGKRKGYLQKLVAELQLQDHVFFKGQVEDPFSGMEDADLFLMGSYYEGFPNVLLEAGALGIPAIAFDVPGGISEIITEGENGRLVEDNDIIAFAAAIRNSLSANFNRTKIIESTQQRFSVNRLVAQTEKLLTGLI
jgi:glycosyltransferase involved in cell wall biosynthesis